MKSLEELGKVKSQVLRHATQILHGRGVIRTQRIPPVYRPAVRTRDGPEFTEGTVILKAFPGEIMTLAPKEKNQ